MPWKGALSRDIGLVALARVFWVHNTHGCECICDARTPLGFFGECFTCGDFSEDLILGGFFDC